MSVNGIEACFPDRGGARGPYAGGMTHCARFALALVLLLGAAPARAENPKPGSPAADEAAVRALLADQVAAWNRHDLEGYMRGYWNSPELRFFAGAAVTRGWRETLERYRRRYQSDGKEMGALEMREVEVQVLSPKHAFAHGHWHLTFSDGKTAEGLFTLLLEKKPEGWRVVHDHSS